MGDGEGYRIEQRRRPTRDELVLAEQLGGRHGHAVPDHVDAGAVERDERQLCMM